MTNRDFLLGARDAYRRVNEKSLSWMLDRPRLKGAFLDTKQNSITLRDYDAGDVWRGPATHYGWIQGRGLEAVIMHAQFFRNERPDLAKRLIAAAKPLYQALDGLHQRDGHAYFTYDDALSPIYPDGDNRPAPQAPAGDLFTYSDIFVLKGLLAASTEFDPSATARHARSLAAIVDAVDSGRFVMDEKQALTADALAAQHDEYGPRMIMLGAAAVLSHAGLAEQASFADRFIAHVVDRHLDKSPDTVGRTFLRDAPGFDRCNPGHAIEFVGLALECRAESIDAGLMTTLRDILVDSFRIGFSPPGLCLGVSLDTGARLSDFYPWWSLPEAVRSASLIYLHTRDERAFEVWRQAHDAFFANYWRDDASLAYQMRTANGPVDHAPATPDLDPGYHTGLSFLSTITTIDALLAAR